MDKKKLLELLENWENMELILQHREMMLACFPLLMEIALYDRSRFSWRAAWAADKIHEKNPGIASTWVGRMAEALPGLKHHGKKRQFLKLISLSPLQEEQESFLLDFCIEKLCSSKETIAVKAYSMQILYNISEKEPDFKPELLDIIEQEMEIRPDPGIVAKGKKLAAKLRSEIA